jgi:hypothetical protein
MNEQQSEHVAQMVAALQKQLDSQAAQLTTLVKMLQQLLRTFGSRKRPIGFPQ